LRGEAEAIHFEERCGGMDCFAGLAMTQSHTGLAKSAPISEKRFRESLDYEFEIIQQINKRPDIIARVGCGMRRTYRQAGRPPALASICRQEPNEIQCSEP
jgi:hypothetical protein